MHLGSPSLELVSLCELSREGEGWMELVIMVHQCVATRDSRVVSLCVLSFWIAKSKIEVKTTVENMQYTVVSAFENS